MGRDRAAYMRDYRAKKSAATADREMSLVMGTGRAVHDALKVDLDAAQDRIRDLENEVRRLKRELADRPAPTFNSRPFTPVPKPTGHSRQG